MFGDRVDFTTLERPVLEVTAFPRPLDYREHFKERYGPTIATFAHARENGREAELDEALATFCHEWNRGTDEQARFEMEYLSASATAISPEA